MMNEKIDAAIEAFESRERDEAELAELKKLGEEAQATFPAGWRIKLYEAGTEGVTVTVEFPMVTKPTAVEALRAAIDQYIESAARQPEDVKRIVPRLYRPDGSPLA